MRYRVRFNQRHLRFDEPSLLPNKLIPPNVERNKKQLRDLPPGLPATLFNLQQFTRVHNVLTAQDKSAELSMPEQHIRRPSHWIMLA